MSATSPNQLSEDPSTEAFAAYDAAQALEAEMFDAKAYAESPAEHLSKIHRVAQAHALDAFVEPWRSKLAEQADLHEEMIAALRGAYRAMDFLFAKCIENIPNFRPTQSGVWSEMVAVFELLQKVNTP